MWREAPKGWVCAGFAHWLQAVLQLWDHFRLLLTDSPQTPQLLRVSLEQSECLSQSINPSWETNIHTHGCRRDLGHFPIVWGTWKLLLNLPFLAGISEMRNRFSQVTDRCKAFLWQVSEIKQQSGLVKAVTVIYKATFNIKAEHETPCVCWAVRWKNWLSSTETEDFDHFVTPLMLLKEERSWNDNSDVLYLIFRNIFYKNM